MSCFLNQKLGIPPVGDREVSADLWCNRFLTLSLLSETVGQGVPLAKERVWWEEAVGHPPFGLTSSAVVAIASLLSVAAIGHMGSRDSPNTPSGGVWLLGWANRTTRVGEVVFPGSSGPHRGWRGPAGAICVLDNTVNA